MTYWKTPPNAHIRWIWLHAVLYAAVYLFCLWIMIHEEVKAEHNCCQSHYHLLLRGHPSLAKYCIVWATFSR